MKDFQSFFLDYFPFFQITSDYPISFFPKLTVGKTTTNLDDSAFTRLSTLLYFSR